MKENKKKKTIISLRVEGRTSFPLFFRYLVTIDRIDELKKGVSARVNVLVDDFDSPINKGAHLVRSSLGVGCSMEDENCR